MTTIEFKAEVATQISNSMRSGNKIELETYRSINAQIMLFEKANPGKEWTIIEIVNPMAKARKQSIEAYKLASEIERQQQEEAELAILEKFLPKVMTRDEIDVKLNEILSKIGPVSQKEMGKFLNQFKVECPGQDLKIASELVKTKLS